MVVGREANNNLTDGSGNLTSPYGEMVSLYTNTDVVAPTDCEMAVRANAAIVTAEQAAGAAPAAESPPTAASQVTPGSGSVTAPDGTPWAITSSGCITAGGQAVDGGCETSAVRVINGTIYGLDSTGRGWFTWSGEWWTSSAGPPL